MCEKEREEEQDEGGGEGKRSRFKTTTTKHVSRNEIAKSFNALLELWT